MTYNHTNYRPEEPFTADEMWDTLLDWGVNKQTLDIVSAIQGYSTDTMEAVLYAFTGYNNFEQAIDGDGMWS